jgi:hypothetical protein
MPRAVSSSPQLSFESNGIPADVAEPESNSFRGARQLSPMFDADHGSAAEPAPSSMRASRLALRPYGRSTQGKLAGTEVPQHLDDAVPLEAVTLVQRGAALSALDNYDSPGPR